MSVANRCQRMCVLRDLLSRVKLSRRLAKKGDASGAHRLLRTGDAESVDDLKCSAVESFRVG